MKVFAIALNTFREAFRNKILYSILFFAFLVVGVAVSRCRPQRGRALDAI